MNRCRLIFRRMAAAAMLSMVGLGAAHAESGQWSVSLNLSGSPGVQPATSVIGDYGISIAGHYGAGLWAAQLMDGLGAPSAAKAAGNFSISTVQLSAAVRGGDGLDPHGTDLALRWGAQVSDDLRVAFGPTVTVGRRDGLQFGVTPSGALPFGTRPGEPGPGLRGFGLQGSAAYRLSGNFTVLGVLGYQRPVDEPNGPSNSFFSMLGIGYRF